LLGDVSNRGARDFDPGLGEQGASTHHEDNVENSVDGVSEDREEISGGRNVIGETTNGDRVTTHFDILPLTEESNGKESYESSVEELGEEIEVGDQSSVEHDGDVGGIEQLDGEVGGVSLNALLLNVEIDSETLEVDDDQEDEDGGEQVVEVGETLSVESLLEGSDLVGFSDQKVEESNNGSFVLSTVFSDDGNGGEGSPEDVFADVGSNEKRDTRSTETPSLAEDFIEHHDNDTGEGELDDDQDGVTSTDSVNITVLARPDSGKGFEESDEQTEKLLSTIEQGTIFFIALINVDDLSTSQKLHNHTTSNDRGDTEFHKSTSVRGKDNSHPVERIATNDFIYTVKGHLAADQVDKEDDTSPEGSSLEGDEFSVGLVDFG